MKILFNKKMEDLLKRAKITSVNDDSIPLPQDLKEFFSNGLETVEHGIYFKENIKALRNSRVGDFPDKTGLECFINTISLDVYYVGESVETLLRLCISAAKALANLLHKEGGKFTIICSLDEEELLSATLRFHKQRDGENWLNFDKLDNYSEAIFVFKVG